MRSFARVTRASLSSSLLSSTLFFIASFSSTSNANAVPFDNSTASLHHLEKRDPSYVPANIALEGCSVKNRNFAPFKFNPHIQMGECYMNARISPQAFAWFEPTEAPTAMTEGGIYGTCYATSTFPTSENLISVENVNYACFLWTEKNLGPIPKLTGKEMIPFPTVCPSTLGGCYSKGVYDNGGKMGAWGSLVPTFSGLWRSSKGPNHQFLWCNHIQPNCPTPTNLQCFHVFDLALIENLPSMKCNVANCPKYPGVVTVLDDATRAKSSNTGLKPGPSYQIQGGKMVTSGSAAQVPSTPAIPPGGGTAPGGEVPPTAAGGTAAGAGTGAGAGTVPAVPGAAPAAAGGSASGLTSSLGGAAAAGGGAAAAAPVPGTKSKTTAASGLSSTKQSKSSSKGQKAAAAATKNPLATLFGGRRELSEGLSVGERGSVLPRRHLVKSMHRRRHI